MEEWRDIEGYEGLYQVSNEVKVMNVKNGKIKKPWINNSGYVIIDLNKNGLTKHKLLHRLMAEAFIPNPENKPTVNHINHIRTDNRLENLEWATYPEQNDEIMRERDSKSKKGSISPMKGKLNREDVSKSIYQYTLDGKLVGIWPSGMEIKRELGFDSGNVSKCCNGKMKTYKCYKWSFNLINNNHEASNLAS